MLRTLAMISLLLATAITSARQPVASPIYYLTTAPEVREGAPVSGTLTPESGRNFKDGSYLDVLVLRGREGEVIELRASSPAFDTYLTLFAPSGAVVDWNDDDFERGGTDSLIRTTLSETGTYVVVVSGFSSADLGPYQVELRMRGGPGVGSGEIGVPSLTTAALRPGASDHYLLTITEATVVGMEARSSEFDTYLEVVDAGGWTMAENDDMLGTTDSGVVVWLDVGTYQVIVSAFGSHGGGAYTLLVDRYVRAP
jgi:hypothetical protein